MNLLMPSLIFSKSFERATHEQPQDGLRRRKTGLRYGSQLWTQMLRLGPTTTRSRTCARRQGRAPA